MSLSYRQQQWLRRLDAGLRRSDSELHAKFDMVGRLYRAQDMTAAEQARRAAPSHARLRRAAAWLTMARAGPARRGRAGRLGPFGPLGWEADVDRTDG
jgi:hypothetical protein